MFVLLFVLNSAACKSEPDAQGWPALFGYSPTAMHSFEIGPFGYPYVPVGIGSDTLWLPFDTGNMVGLTLQVDTFLRLALPCSESHNRRDSAGQLVSTGCIAHGVRTSLFGTESDSTSVYEFVHETLPGLVGPTSMPGTRFTIDYRERILAIDNRSGPVAIEGFEALPLISSPTHPRLILVGGRVEGREVIIEIDTGKSRTTIDRELVGAPHLERTSRSRGRYLWYKYGAAGEDIARSGVGRSLRVRAHRGLCLRPRVDRATELTSA